MKTEEWPHKDKDEVLDYSLSWEKQMLHDSDSLQSVTWIVPPGLSKGGEALVGNIASVWLSGGDPGVAYFITCRATTTGLRTHDRLVRLYVSR